MKRYETSRRNYGIYIKAALVVLAVYILLACIIGSFIGLFAELIAPGYERADFDTVVCVVKPGDTSWDYADHFCPVDMDKRLYLEWCAEENGIESMSTIYSGKSYVFLKLK